MKNFSNTISMVVSLAILGCDNKNNLKYAREESEIFPLSTDGERSNANHDYGY